MISKEMWAEWLESPVTEQLRKYLLDSVNEHGELVSEVIKSGGTLSEAEQIRIGVECQVLITIAELELEVIEDFYNKGES